jgi:hypothetical protein
MVLITVVIAKAPIRLAIKLGVSLAKTTPFPKIFSPTSTILSTMLLDVVFAGMISKSFIYLGGLKKWVPRNLSSKSLEKPSHILLMEIPEVLELTTVPSFKKGINFLNNSLFIFKSSSTTSIIQSAWETQER